MLQALFSSKQLWKDFNDVLRINTVTKPPIPPAPQIDIREEIDMQTRFAES